MIFYRQFVLFFYFFLLPILVLSQSNKFEIAINSGTTHSVSLKDCLTNLGFVFNSSMQYNFNNHLALKTGFVLRRNNIVSNKFTNYYAINKTSARIDYLSVPFLMQISIGKKIKTYFQFGPYADLFQYSKYANYFGLNYDRETFLDNKEILLGIIGFGVDVPIKKKLVCKLELNSMIPSNKQAVFEMRKSFSNYTSSNLTIGIGYKFGFKKGFEVKNDSTVNNSKKNNKSKYKIEFITRFAATKGTLGLPVVDVIDCPSCRNGNYFIGSLRSGIGFGAGLGFSKIKLEKFKYSNRFYLEFEMYNYSGKANFRDSKGNVCEHCRSYDYQGSFVKLNYTGQFNLYNVKGSTLYIASGISSAVFSSSMGSETGRSQKVNKIIPFLNHSAGILIKSKSNYFRIEPLIYYQMAGELGSKGINMGFIF